MARFAKSAALSHWRNLAPAQPLKPEPIAYKHQGTTFGADGIRIEGRQEFVNAVLSRLHDLLQCENTETRLALNYQQVEAKDGKPNVFAGNWVCYVKVHERGHEAKMVNAYASGIVGREVIASRGY